MTNLTTTGPRERGIEEAKGMVVLPFAGASFHISIDLTDGRAFVDVDLGPEVRAGVPRYQHLVLPDKHYLRPIAEAIHGGPLEEEQYWEDDEDEDWDDDEEPA